MKSILRLVLFLSLVAGGLNAAVDPVDAVQRLRESLKTVDRLVLMRSEWDKPDDRDQGRSVIEIKGVDVIATLGDTLEIKQFDMECLCEESPEMRFYQGESYRFSMTLHHSQRLRGQDAVWGGDAVLTDQSAEKFRAWFAERGYDGFEKRYVAGLEAISADKAQRDKFLEIFPESVRLYFPGEDDKYDWHAKRKKQQKIGKHYHDQTALILDCWRGLGAYPTSFNGGDWKREYQDFLHDILNASEISQLQKALQALPAGEDRVWVGAYHYYQWRVSHEEDRMFTAYSEDWLARLAKRVIPLAKNYESKWIVSNLVKRPAAATNSLLFEIAESGSLDMPKKESNGGLIPYLELPTAASALLGLAKNQVSECRPVIHRRFADVTDVEVRLALEVALAQFDGPGAIKPAHLQSKIPEVAEMAWVLVTKDPNAQVSIETLAVLAGKSESFRTREAAAEKLMALGLRVVTDQERAAAVLSESRFAEAKSFSQIEVLIGEIQNQAINQTPDVAERQILAALNHRKGRLILKEGNYELAASLLSGGYADRSNYAEQAFALQALGRFNEAASHLNRSIKDENEETMSKYLEQRGYLAFAQQRYDAAAENFAAAVTVDRVSEERALIMRQLSLLLTGKESRSDLMAWEDWGFLDESGGKRPQADWPVTGIYFLQGKLSETDLIGRIRLDKNNSSGELCEAHFMLSVLRRVKGDHSEERRHLQAVLATKSFTNQCYSLAMIRSQELSLTNR